MLPAAVTPGCGSIGESERPSSSTEHLSTSDGAAVVVQMTVLRTPLEHLNETHTDFGRGLLIQIAQPGHELSPADRPDLVESNLAASALNGDRQRPARQQKPADVQVTVTS